MNKFGKASIILAGLLLPLTLLISGFVAWQLKESNPNNVDVTASLAYLGQILGTTLSVGATLWLLSLICALLGLRRDQSKELSKLGILVLVLVTVFSIGAGIVNDQVTDVEDRAKEKAAQEFFQKLDNN